MTPKLIEALVGAVLAQVRHLSRDDAASAVRVVLDWIRGGGDDPVLYAPEFAPQLEALRRELYARAEQAEGWDRHTPHEGVKPSGDDET